MSKKYDYLIVGAGLFGSTFAHEAKKAGKNCLVIDKRSHLGGNIYCENVDGINIHKYGAHIFHTNDKKIWDYVNSFVEFNEYVNSPIAYFEGKIYNMPFNMNTFNQLWGVITPAQAKAKLEEERREYANIEPKNLEEQALKLCGKRIYEIFVKGYTEKQWGKKASELPVFIIKRIPFRFTYNNNYFDDPYCGIPKGGYNKLIEKMLDGIDVKLNTNYSEHRGELNDLADKIIFTGCIDDFFDFKLGRLEYRSLKFEQERLDIDDFQGNAVVNYCEREVPFTRIIEHKHFEFGKQNFTIISREYPAEFENGNEPYYPINSAPNTELYKKYAELSKNHENVIFGGRLAQYSYFDMDDTIIEALRLAERIL